MFEFSNEASRLILDYVKDVRNLIGKLGFEIKPVYLEMLMFDVENYVKFFSLKHTRKRKSRRVEAVDVRYVLKKFGDPEKFVKSHLGDPENCANAQMITLSHLRAMKDRIEKTRAPIVLDAGCGWGRVLKKII